MDFWPTIYVFVLATFIGLGVIRRVSRLLHTPLMSLTNAISAIAVVGAILVAGGGYAKELSADDRARQSQLLAEECAQSDVVITTALIGGVFAPRLINADTVRAMKPGSVIVDLGADGGGNCELSKPGETVHVGGVTIIAPLNLPATMPFHASLLFSRNLTAFILAFTKEKAFQLDLSDDIQQGALITHEGSVTHTRTREALDKR